MSLVILFQVVCSICPVLGIYQQGHFTYKGDVAYSNKLPAIEEIMGPCDVNRYLQCIKHPDCKAVEMCDQKETELCRICYYTNPRFIENATDKCRHLQLDKKLNDEKGPCSIGSGRNVALNKSVSLSSLYTGYEATTKGSLAVDGSFNSMAHTGFEKRPWLRISLQNLHIIEKIVVYNRMNFNGRWLHDFEIRTGQTTEWDQMSTCGTFVGVSEAGKSHTVVCSECFPSRYVTVKIMKDNDVNLQSDALNAVVVSEIEVF